MATSHVLRVESGLAQRDRRLASNVESVCAKHHDRVGLREFAKPLLDALRITPHGAIHDVLLTRDVGAWTSIHDLDWSAGVDHGLDVLDGDARQIPELFLDERSWPLDPRCVLVARLGRRPVDVPLERIDVRLRVGPEVDVIGMLVHVESQEWLSMSRRERPLRSHGRVLIGVRWYRITGPPGKALVPRKIDGAD